MERVMALKHTGAQGFPPLYLDSHPLESPDPLVSIIIDNYNYAEFLPAAIESALSQSYPYVEVLVVDDGSTDDSRSEIGTFAGRVTVVLQDNAGQAAAFNAGFARSRGAIAIFLDADDVLLPDAALMVVQEFRRDPTLAKVHFRMSVVDACGRATGATKPPDHAHMADGDLREHYLTFPDDVWRLPTSGNAFSAAVLGLVLPIDETAYRGGADTYLTHLTPLYGRVRYVPTVCALYRVHGRNSYELDEARLNLARIRRNVTHSRQTHAQIVRRALELGLLKQPRDILSASYVLNRMMSLKLQPSRHPIPEDSTWKLVALGLRASVERFDVSRAMVPAYMLWLIAMALGPRPLAWRLARYMVFPQARPRFNRLLKVLQRG